MAEPQQVYDVKHIEKIVDQVFPLMAQAEFIKSVHGRDGMKLKAYGFNKKGEKTERLSEPVAFMRRYVLAAAMYYSDSSTRLQKNLENAGYDEEFGISLHPPELPAEQPQAEADAVWEEFEMDNATAFPNLSDQEYQQYLIAGSEVLSQDDGYEHVIVPLVAIDKNGEPMDCDMNESDDSGIDESMEMEFTPIAIHSSSSLLPSPTNSGFENDHLGLQMHCDQDGMPIDFLE